MEIQKDRPPYVTFELRPVRDEEKSAESGMAVYEDVEYAIITPVGGKDTVNLRADKWLAQSARQVEEQRMPAEWLAHYKSIYAAWKAGQETPLNGLSVKLWPVATPADVQNLLAANILTVEDLAQANEASLMRLGMGSRALKQKAVAYLKSADQGKFAESFSKLEDAYAAAMLRLDALEKENKDLASQLATKAKAA